MDFQDIIFKLDRYWAKQGCALLPPGGAARRAPGGQLCLAGAAGRAALPPDGLEGRYRYRVVLDPAPPDVRRAFLDSLRAVGLDRSEHDVRWLAFDGEAGTGWEVLLDGLPLARFAYLPAPEGGGVRPAAAEIVTGLERLALVSQRKKQPADLCWAGRLTYGELHGGEGQ